MSRRLIRRHPLPDLFFASRYSLSPYKGCGHACRYCDGRAEKYYVEGDFSRDIEVREWIPEGLESELAGLREEALLSLGSGVSDVYQPREETEQLTRRCAGILAGADQPTMVLTKGTLPLRDRDLWRPLAEKGRFLLAPSGGAHPPDLCRGEAVRQH